MKSSCSIAVLVALCLGVICSSEAYSQTTQNSPEIWLGPQGLPSSKGNLPVNEDFMDMFTPDAPWTEAASHTQVFMLESTHMTPGSQDQINTVVADLNRRHIKIALEVGAINVGASKDNPCGGTDMEGYGTPARAKTVSEMIKKAGGQVAYIVMDEPLMYGHFMTGVHTNMSGMKLTFCNFPVSKVVDLVAPTLNAYIQEFPNVLIGQTEPTRIVVFPNWQNDFLAWATGYQATMKRPLAFIHLDIPWLYGPPSKEPADTLAFYKYMQQLQQQGLIEKIGIIWNGQPKDATDAEWIQDAESHVKILEGKYGLRPDQAIFQSWIARPSHALPETDPSTLTSLIDWYVSPARR